MIKTSFDSQQALATIVLQPNHSWTWRANLYLIASLLVISLSVGLVLTFLGYWMILIFTTAEIAVLTFCLYWCVEQTHRQEVLRLSHERLVIETGTRKPSQRVDVQRLLARIFFNKAQRLDQKPTVVVRFGEQEIEIGGFLSTPEKGQLVKILHNTIVRLDGQSAAQ